MPKVILVNPSNSTVGYSIVVPRWLYVIAAATPTELVGDPLVIDEPVRRFDPAIVQPGDIVGIGIHTGNCLPGYRVLREAKARAATVVVGGIHATIFPDEPLERGADAVVTGNGDLVWTRVVQDVVDGKLSKRYDGGRVPGDALLKANWNLLDSRRYLLGSIQTVAGCPENCSFCSVWVTDGRKPRQHLTGKIIDEANELYRRGFRYLFFADDNFGPATLARIAREPGHAKRRELERIRGERLRFFEEYDRAVPRDLCGLTQTTAEVVSDEEYLSAMYERMRIRGVLVGIESYSEAGLRHANKLWNPVGPRMVDAVRHIQDHGILVLSSIICGLESDTVETLRTMRRFARESGTALAQFPIYCPLPGTVDFHALLKDAENRGREGFTPARRIELLQDKFWLEHDHATVVVRHPNMRTEELVAEVRRSWRSFYSLREILARTRRGIASRLSLASRLTYVFGCLAFDILYPEGVAADNVRSARVGLLDRLAMRVVVLLSRRSMRGDLRAPKHRMGWTGVRA